MPDHGQYFRAGHGRRGQHGRQQERGRRAGQRAERPRRRRHGARNQRGPLLRFPEQFIEQPLNFQEQVAALAPGQATVVADGPGYEVVEVRSRAVIPYSNRIAADIEIVASHGGSQAPPNGDTKVNRILKDARVEVNPAYGSWSTTLPQNCAPQVVALIGAACVG